MTEADWHSCTDPQRMLEFLQESGQATDRKLRLFACTCYRRKGEALHVFTQEVVEVVERLADSSATEADLEIAYDKAWRGPSPAPEAGWVASHVPREAAERSAPSMAQHLGLLVDPSGILQYRKVVDAEKLAQAGLLRDIFGNPFRPLQLDPAWLTDTVLRLAEAACEHRELPSGHLDRTRLAELADALEGAGCHDSVVLGHLRGAGPHVRGCCVLDLLLKRA